MHLEALYFKVKVAIFFRVNPFLCFPVEEWPYGIQGKEQVPRVWVIFLVDPFVAAYTFVSASVQKHRHKWRVIASGGPSWCIALWIWLRIWLHLLLPRLCGCGLLYASHMESSSISGSLLSSWLRVLVSSSIWG